MGTMNPMGGGGRGMSGTLTPLLGSQEPRQTRRRYEMIDPLQNLPAERSVMQGMLFNPPYLTGRTGQLPGIPAATGTFVGPQAQQRQALAAYGPGLQAAAPAYQTGLRTIEQTAGGAFLDPMQRAEFQRMSEARQALARQLFGETAADINQRAAAQGIYGSSAREAALGRAQAAMATQAAQDIAQAGWQQYGAERGAQEAAARAGAQIAPGIAGQMFGAGEQIRSAEQQARQFQAQQAQQAAELRLRGQLEAMGLDQRAVTQALEYMRLAAGDVSFYLAGPSPYQESLQTIKTAGSLMPGLGSAAAGATPPATASPGGSIGWT
jgi:hypothetical protein